MMRLPVLMILPFVLGAVSPRSPRSFLQVKKNIDDDNAQAADMARMEDEVDKLEGEDDDATKSDDDESSQDSADSFIQVKKNIDDDNAQAAEMARMEDEVDKLEGEDESETSKSDDGDESEDEGESFIQVKKNIDDENAQAAEMARMEEEYR